MKRYVGMMLAFVSVLAVAGCKKSAEPAAAVSVPALPTDEQVFEKAYADLAAVPTGRTAKQPLVLVHYMPWFQAPPASDGYGYHWHLGGTKFDPYTVQQDGRRSVATHYYPLTGPYDSGDTLLLQYQVALMKLAGIDGVIFDWYGMDDVLDYAPIHQATIRAIQVLRSAGMKYAICYEDQSIGKMVEATYIQKQDAVATARATFAYMDKEWFGDGSYLTFDGRPVVYCFGPQYFFAQSEWDDIFSTCTVRPWFTTLEGHSEQFADGSYNWFNMDGVKDIPQVVRQLNSFYASQGQKPHLTATAYSGFRDIYASAGQQSYGHLSDYDGKTFNLTLAAAQKAMPDVIQVATWNDYGEGTMVEPTAENGYRELEALQELRRGYDDGFAYSFADLRAPIELYKAIRGGSGSAEYAQKALDALLADDEAGFRSALRDGKITVDFAVRPLLESASAGDDGQAVALYDAAGRANLAKAAVIKASSKIYDFLSGNTVDGDVNTYWEGAANAYPNTLDVDWQEDADVDIIVLKLNPQRVWGRRAQTIEVQASSDGQSFATLISASDYVFDPQANANTVVIPVGAHARAVRLVFTANTGATAGQVAELEVYATK